MASSVRIDGLGELLRQLRQMQEPLWAEARDVIRDAAEQTARDAQLAYPEGPTGNLRRGIRIERNETKWGVGYLVRSAAPHAWIFENGTAQRTTRGPAGRRSSRARTDRRGPLTPANRGRMPKPPREQAFRPVAIDNRREMYARLRALLERAGLAEVQTP